MRTTWKRDNTPMWFVFTEIMSGFARVISTTATRVGELFIQHGIQNEFNTRAIRVNQVIPTVNEAER